MQGEQKNQLLILSDKNGNRIDVATREECHRNNGKTHLAFMAFVVDKDGKIILARRSRKKSLWPLFWDASVVSHVLPKETVEQAAKRRAKEELGIEINFQNIGSFYYFAKYKRGSENEYCYVLVGKSDLEFHPNPAEIDEVKRISLEELENEIKKTPDFFTPWLKIALEKIDMSGFT